ncbi:MAG: FAD-dependent oxidoreductase [Turneriella sp.]|nr:FAD-dependent oxidoreductase [Turneriella sp.]
MKQEHDSKKVVILGGGYAGVNAALRLRVRDKAVHITLVNERGEFVERIRNHQKAAGATLKRLDLRQVLGNGIAFVQGGAENIDTAMKQVLVKTATGIFPFAYDILVYAPGSGAPAARTMNAFRVNTADAAAQLKDALRHEPRRGLTIVGAGLTGIELATELREAWPERKITIYDRHTLGHGFSEKARRYFAATFAAMNIHFVADEAPETQDIRINCTGFYFPDLARRSGLPVDAKNRVLVDEALRVRGFADIFACGDAAAYGFGSEAIDFAGCQTAMPMGTHSGDAIAALLRGKEPEAFRFGFPGRCVSLGRKRGLVQFVDKYSGAPREKILTGRVAAIIKELICKMTTAAPAWERKTGWPIYTWLKTRLTRRGGQVASRAA